MDLRVNIDLLTAVRALKENWDSESKESYENLIQAWKLQAFL